MKVDSFVGLIPLFAVETLEPDVLAKLPHFRRRMNWFLKYRPEMVAPLASLTEPGEEGRLLLSLVDRSKLERVLRRMLDPDAFLSDYGLRALSKRHEAEPYTLHLDGRDYTVRYEPAESTTGLFGGNSNWRGPIWFPVNHLMIESLQKFDHYYGDRLKVEHPAAPASSCPSTMWRPTSRGGSSASSSATSTAAGPSTAARTCFSTTSTGATTSSSTSTSTATTARGSARATRPGGRRSSPS